MNPHSHSPAEPVPPAHQACVHERRSRINWDRLGMLASLACGIHCLALPVAMPLLMASGFEFVANPWFELAMSLSIVLIGGRTLTLPRHQGPLGLVGLGLYTGLILLVAGNLHTLFSGHGHHGDGGLEFDAHLLIPAGALLVAASNALDWWRARHQGCAHSPH